MKETASRMHCCYLPWEWRIVAVVRQIDTGIEGKAQPFPVVLKSSYWQKLTGLRWKVGDEGFRVSASALQTWVWSWETNVYYPACSALSTTWYPFRSCYTYLDFHRIAKTLCSHLTRCNLFLTKKDALSFYLKCGVNKTFLNR